MGKPDTSPAECIFCKIINGQVQSPKVQENEEFICIRDIRPQAETHLLVVPRDHIVSLDSAFPTDGTSSYAPMIGRMFEFGTQVARKQGLLPGGFRAVINTGSGGGQTVWHLHLHLLGSKKPLGDNFG